MDRKTGPPSIIVSESSNNYVLGGAFLLEVFSRKLRSQHSARHYDLWLPLNRGLRLKVFTQSNQMEPSIRVGT